MHEGTELGQSVRSLGRLLQGLEVGCFEGSHGEEYTEMFGENSDTLAQVKPNPIKDFLILFGVSLSPYQDPSRKCGKDRKKTQTKISYGKHSVPSETWLRAVGHLSWPFQKMPIWPVKLSTMGQPCKSEH